MRTEFCESTKGDSLETVPKPQWRAERQRPTQALPVVRAIDRHVDRMRRQYGVTEDLSGRLLVRKLGPACEQF
jgi:hypothetical protein